MKVARTVFMGECLSNVMFLPTILLRDGQCSLRSLQMEHPIDFTDLALYACSVTSFAEK
ncbi:hypothetical protein SDA64_10965 [Legionella pneumophila serogroup 1]